MKTTPMDYGFLTNDPDGVVARFGEGEPTPTAWCDTCRMIHAMTLPCAVVKARIEAMIIEPGELLGEDEIGDCDRVALLGALRVRELALEPEGDRWRVVEVRA